MKRSHSVSAALAAVAIIAAGCAVTIQPATNAQTQAGGWVHLGTRVVNFRAERDAIQVTARQGRFQRIALTVADNGVQFGMVKVVFGNGVHHEVNLRSFIPAGGTTRAIDLPGQRRIIRRVVFVYRSNNQNLRRARVSLWGLP